MPKTYKIRILLCPTKQRCTESTDRPDRQPEYQSGSAPRNRASRLEVLHVQFLVVSAQYPTAQKWSRRYETSETWGTDLMDRISQCLSRLPRAVPQKTANRWRSPQCKVSPNRSSWGYHARQESDRIFWSTMIGQQPSGLSGTYPRRDQKLPQLPARLEIHTQPSPLNQPSKSERNAANERSYPCKSAEISWVPSNVKPTETQWLSWLSPRIQPHHQHLKDNFTIVRLSRLSISKSTCICMDKAHSFLEQHWFHLSCLLVRTKLPWGDGATGQIHHETSTVVQGHLH